MAGSRSPRTDPAAPSTLDPRGLLPKERPSRAFSCPRLGWPPLPGSSLGLRLRTRQAGLTERSGIEAASWWDRTFGEPTTAARPVAVAPAPGDGRPLVVNVVPFSIDGWRWFEADTADQIRWEFFGPAAQTWPERKLRWSSLALTRGCHRAVRFAHRAGAKLLISHDPKATYRCAEVNRRLAEPIPHLAWSFNFAALPKGIKRRLMTAAFRDVDRFIVFSTMERELYANYFDLPIDRFTMIHWAMGPLAMDPPDRPTIRGTTSARSAGTPATTRR